MNIDELNKKNDRLRRFLDVNDAPDEVKNSLEKLFQIVFKRLTYVETMRSASGAESAFCEACWKVLYDFAGENNGYIYVNPDGKMFQGDPRESRLCLVKCLRCGGDGKDFGKKCDRCHGRGTVMSIVPTNAKELWSVSEHDQKQLDRLVEQGFGKAAGGGFRPSVVSNF